MHHMFGQRVQTVEGQAHVDRLPVQEYPYPAFREEHQRVVIVRTMPPPRSIIRSIPAVGVGTDAGGCTMDATPAVLATFPKSMNAGAVWD